jgi:GcrA cell cycle regulator
MTWTDERISDLVRLWDAGHTASHIGKAIGVSKNAVIGKAHRLKLPPRPSPIRQSAVPRAPKPVPPPAPKRIAKVRPRPIFRAARAAGNGAACLWPIGDPSTADFHFCGAEAVAGKPYCDEHCARAYVTRQRGESQAA